jgi:hypothetical protein
MIATVGPLLLGLALAISSWLAASKSRGVGDLGLSFMLGIVGGLVIFGPIAIALAISKRHSDWRQRNAYRINWYTSVTMCFALGYFVAWIRHGVLDYFGIIAIAVVGLGAAIKIALAAVESKK